MMHQSVVRTLCLAALVAVAGCRGMRSEDPPIHPNLNMDYQEKFQAQEANPFFADNAAMRLPVPGTVARGFLAEDPVFYLGRTPSGEYVEEMPVPATRELILRGQERYDIFCTVCHGQAGDGQGIIMTGNYGYTPAPSYHQERLRDAADGYIYDVIANGVRNMPGYAQQVPVADRWAIVSYIRALQRSQNATEADVPPSVLARIEQGSSANMNAARAGTGGTGAASDSTQGAAQDGTAGAAQDTTQDVAAQDSTQAAAPPADTAQADSAQADTAQAGAAQADTAQAAAPSDTASAVAQSDAAGAAQDTAQGAIAQGDTAAAAAGGAAQGGEGEASTAGGQAPASGTAAAPVAGAGSSLGLVQIFALFLLGLFLIAAIGIGIVAWRRPKNKETAAH